MKTNAYLEKLRDPRWQKKRLEILQRDNFQCCDCQSKTETLHVHHWYYIKDRQPWDYPDWTYITLCQDCHSMHQDIGANFQSNWEMLVDLLHKVDTYTGNPTGWFCEDILKRITAAVTEEKDVVQVMISMASKFQQTQE